MRKLKFKSKKKEKINLIKDDTESIYNELISISHTEIFSNKRIILEGCINILEYDENYIKLKLKRGFITLCGAEFIITSFDDGKIDIKGNIITIEFCV